LLATTDIIIEDSRMSSGISPPGLLLACRRLELETPQHVSPSENFAMLKGYYALWPIQGLQATCS